MRKPVTSSKRESANVGMRKPPAGVAMENIPRRYDRPVAGQIYSDFETVKYRNRSIKPDQLLRKSKDRFVEAVSARPTGRTISKPLPSGVAVENTPLASRPKAGTQLRGRYIVKTGLVPMPRRTRSAKPSEPKVGLSKPDGFDAAVARTQARVEAGRAAYADFPSKDNKSASAGLRARAAAGRAKLAEATGRMAEATGRMAAKSPVVRASKGKTAKNVGLAAMGYGGLAYTAGKLLGPAMSGAAGARAGRGSNEQSMAAGDVSRRRVSGSGKSIDVNKTVGRSALGSVRNSGSGSAMNLALGYGVDAARRVGGSGAGKKSQSEVKAAMMKSSKFRALSAADQRKVATAFDQWAVGQDRFNPARTAARRRPSDAMRASVGRSSRLSSGYM